MSFISITYGRQMHPASPSPSGGLPAEATFFRREETYSDDAR